MNRRDLSKFPAAAALFKHAVNAVTIGYERPAEIEEAIRNIGFALNA